MVGGGEGIYLIGVNSSGHTNMSLVVPSVKSVLSLDVIYNEQYPSIFWSGLNTGSIRRTWLNESLTTIVIISGTGRYVYGIACDVRSNRLYWTDHDRRHVSVSQLDGSQREVLYSMNRGITPVAIVLDPYNG